MPRLSGFAVVAALLLSACTSSAVSSNGAMDSRDDGPGETAVGPNGNPPAELAMAEQPPVPVADPLRLAMARPDSLDLDAAVLSDQAAVVIADLLYDGLVEAAGRTGELRPALATKWFADDTFTRWTFHLRADAPVDAADVAQQLGSLAVGGASDGQGQALSAASLTAGMKVVRAESKRVVTVELESPNAGLPWILSGLLFSIRGADGESTGDYRVTSDDSNGLILHRQGSGATGPSTVHVRWTDEPEQAAALLSAGFVHGALLDGAALGATEPDGESMAGDDRMLATGTSRFYVINAGAPQLVDVGDRRAVLAAIDRTAAVRSGIEQLVVETDGLSGPGLAGWNPNGGCGPTCRNDGAASQLVVAESDQPLQIAYSGQDQASLASTIAEQLSDAGMAAESQPLPPDRLASVIVSGETDLFAFGWIAPAGSVDAVIPPLLRPDSPANIARIQSASVADLLASAAVTGDDKQRWALLAEAERLALADALIVPMAVSASQLRLAPNAGAVVVRADGSLDLDSPE